MLRTAKLQWPVAAARSALRAGEKDRTYGVGPLTDWCSPTDLRPEQGVRNGDEATGTSCDDARTASPPAEVGYPGLRVYKNLRGFLAHPSFEIRIDWLAACLIQGVCDLSRFSQ